MGGVVIRKIVSMIWLKEVLQRMADQKRNSDIFFMSENLGRKLQSYNFGVTKNLSVSRLVSTQV